MKKAVDHIVAGCSALAPMDYTECGLTQLDRVDSTRERSARIEKKCICVVLPPQPCHCAHSLCDSQRNFAFLPFPCPRTRQSPSFSVKSSRLWLRRPRKQFEPSWRLFRRNILSVSRIVLRRSKQIKNTHAFVAMFVVPLD